MFLIILSSVFLCILTWFYYRWTKVSQYWAKRKVPYQPPHPLWGSLTFLQKQNFGLWIAEKYQEFRAPYFGIWLFWRPSLVINDPEISKRVLIQDSNNFRDRFVSSGRSDPLGHYNIFMLNDPIWTNIRRRLSPLFTAAKLRSIHAFIVTKAGELSQRISNDMKKHDKVDLRTVYADYTSDLVGETSFGVASNATLTENSVMRLITTELMHYSTWRGFGWCSMFFFPELVNIFRFTLFPHKTTDTLVKLFQTVVSQRGGYDNVSSGGSKDLLDSLIKIKHEADKQNEDIPEIMLVAQAAAFIQGGFDTGASALTFSTYELAHEPKMQERLYLEILEAKQKNGDEFYNKLNDLPYLDSVMNETLRKYPPLGYLDRVSANSYKIDENLTIPAGTPIYVNAIGMHLDPEYFAEPKKFNPDRFLPENITPRQTSAFMPFGEGPRICIGMKFALHMFKYALATIVLNYEFRPLPGAPKPNDCEIEKKALFLMPGELMYAKFVPRQ